MYNHDEQSTRGLMNTSYYSTSRLYLSKAILQIQRFLSLTILKLNTADSVQVMSTVSSACSRPHHSLRLHVIEYACAKNYHVCLLQHTSQLKVQLQLQLQLQLHLQLRGQIKREKSTCAVCSNKLIVNCNR